MSACTWRHLSAFDQTLEENWLFTLRRERFRSNHSEREHDFYILDLPDAVSVIALTPENQVVLVRQFRVGAERDGLEPPGGLLDEGEDPCMAGERELLEETGYAGDPPVVLGTCWAMPSLMTSRITTLLITNARKVADPKPDHYEEVAFELAHAGQIPRMIRDGRIHHALAVQGLMWWLVADLPESPFAIVRDKTQPWQFKIRTLVWLVVASAVTFAIVRAIGFPGLAQLTILFALPIAWALVQWLDPRDQSVLLRAARLRPGTRVVRALSLVGPWLLIMMALYGLLRLLRLI